jgi:hypothetical protein
LRNRSTNGLSACAVFESPCGELLVRKPAFLAWFLGWLGAHFERKKPRSNPDHQIADLNVVESVRLLHDPSGDRLASLVFGNKMETVANLPTQLERPSAENLSKSA